MENKDVSDSDTIRCKATALGLRFANANAIAQQVAVELRCTALFQSRKAIIIGSTAR
jgi:hypothetical protein